MDALNVCCLSINQGKILCVISCNAGLANFCSLYLPQQLLGHPNISLMPCKQFFPMWGRSCFLRFTDINTRRAFRHRTTIHQIHLSSRFYYSSEECLSFQEIWNVCKSSPSSFWHASAKSQLVLQADKANNLTWESWPYNRLQQVKAAQHRAHFPSPPHKTQIDSKANRGGQVAG